jgi:hypothetical protein
MEIKRETIADKDYTTRAGKSDETKATGFAAPKDTLQPVIQQKPTPKNATEALNVIPIEAKIYYMMQELEKVKKDKKTNSKSGENNLIALPSSYQQEMKAYEQSQKELLSQAQNELAQADSQKAGFELEMVECLVASDYKISTTARMELICRNSKTLEKSKIYASVVISKENEITLVATPEIKETLQGKFIPLEKESKLYHFYSGDSNIATYVDKRAIERINKEMSTTLATSGSQAAKDYVAKKTEASSEVVQTDTSTVTATSSPEPKASDYGISVLVDVIAKGIGAGMEQLYQDLGYIYYIPANTPVKGELYTKQN